LKVCFACKASVEREGCHKNRYGEYICKICMAAGIRFSRLRQLDYLVNKKRRMLWRIAAYGVVLVITTFLLVKLLNDITSKDISTSGLSGRSALLRVS